MSLMGRYRIERLTDTPEEFTGLLDQVITFCDPILEAPADLPPTR